MSEKIIMSHIVETNKNAIFAVLSLKKCACTAIAHANLENHAVPARYVFLIN